MLLPRHSKAVKNRFIYYPDRIVPIPSDYASWMDTNTSKIFEGLWKGLFAEPFRKRRPVEVIDESVGSFVSRRVHPKVSQNLVSAVLHGIYAGDVDRLSMRSVFPLVYKDELEYGSFTMGVLKRWFSRKSSLTKYEQQLLHDLVPLNRTLLAFLASEDAAMLSFAGGMETLVHALSWSLNKFPNVRIKRKSTVKSISRGSHPHTPMQVRKYPGFIYCDVAYSLMQSPGSIGHKSSSLNLFPHHIYTPCPCNFIFTSSSYCTPLIR